MTAIPPAAVDEGPAGSTSERGRGTASGVRARYVSTGSSGSTLARSAVRVPSCRPTASPQWRRSWRGATPERATPDGAMRSAAPRSEAGHLAGHRGLLVRSLVLVDDALAHGLVELGRRDGQGLLGLVGVSGVGGLAELADRRLELGLDRLVALGRQAVRLDPLELGLDVRHWFVCFLWGRYAVEGGSRGRDGAWGHPGTPRAGWCFV